MATPFCFAAARSVGSAASETSLLLSSGPDASAGKKTARHCASLGRDRAYRRLEAVLASERPEASAEALEGIAQRLGVIEAKCTERAGRRHVAQLRFRGPRPLSCLGTPHLRRAGGCLVQRLHTRLDRLPGDRIPGERASEPCATVGP